MTKAATTLRTEKRLLLVCPTFPPINTPDMQRVRMSLPHYRSSGWTPIVLTVDEKRLEGFREPELLATLPCDVKIHRCGAWPLWLSRLLGVGNTGLRSWCHLFFTGFRIIRRERIDLVFFSNTQFVTFTLGRLWRFLLGVPFVIDLQDPWRTDYYEQPGARKPPGGWKYQLARMQARLLEPWTLRKASGLISVSDLYIRDLCARYSWFSAIPTATVPFGVSEEDLKIAKASGTPTPPPSQTLNLVRLIYTGAAGPITPHAAAILLDALSEFRRRFPGHASKLRLEFHGTSYAPADRAKAAILPLARECGVDDLVIENPARIGHLEALKLQAEASALLLPGSTDPAYSPSKLYPYFLAGPPILGLVLRDSVLDRLLRDLSCATIVTFTADGPTPETRSAITSYLESLCTGSVPSTPERNEALFRSRYLAPSLTRNQCALFDRALTLN